MDQDTRSTAHVNNATAADSAVHPVTLANIAHAALGCQLSSRGRGGRHGQTSTAVISNASRGRGRRIIPSLATPVSTSEVVCVPEMPVTVLRPSSVPDSFDHAIIACSRKRAAKPAEWKKKQKTHEMRPVRECECTKECIQKLNGISSRIIEEYRKRYEQSRDWTIQTNLLASMVDVSRYSTGSFRYSFAIPGVDGVKISICRTAFKNIFSLSNDKLSNLTKRLTGQNSGLNTDNGSISAIGLDGRGRSKLCVKNRVHAEIIISARTFLIAQVKKHGVPSHYLQGQSSAIYMPSSCSIKELWLAFLEEEDPEFFSLMSSAREAQTPLDQEILKPLMTKRRFHDLFVSEFGYVKFRKPKTDECKTCLTWKANIASLGTQKSRSEAVNNYKHHRLMAQMGYDVIAFDSEMAIESRILEPEKRSMWIDTLVFDHQKNLMFLISSPSRLDLDTNFRCTILAFSMRIPNSIIFTSGLSGMVPVDRMR